MQSDPLNENIRHFYDRSTKLWLNTWGEHMHHGYYGADGTAKKENQEAQVDLIEELLRWGGVAQASNILDAGCGVGGSARFLSKKYDANVLGLTLSPVQATEAQRFSRRMGLGEKVKIEVQDLMSLTGQDGTFDLVWSCESAEYIRDKQKMLEIFFDVLQPGGRLLMATWCHRNTPPALDNKEERILQQLYDLYFLPPMISIKEYETLAQKVGFNNVKTGDWSNAVAPFWNAVIRTAFTGQSMVGLLRSGWTTIKGAWAMQFMTRGYRMGALKFGVIQGQKP